ncbi:MAG: hypothetical protein PHN88_03675 [Ignavibacteria bacterium]|nr:hypothetical protein [Ignavibacteria bacterium]
MDCKQIREHFLVMAEKGLKKEEEAEITGHLASCSECSALYEKVASAYGLLNVIEEVEPRAFFAESIMNKLDAVTESIKEPNLIYDYLFSGFFKKIALSGAAFVVGLILFFYITEGTISFNFLGEEDNSSSNSVTELFLDNFN